VFQGHGEEFILGSRPHGPDRRENPTTPLEDFEVVRSLHPEGELFLPSLGEAQVGVRVHETGNEREAFAVHFEINITGRKISQYLILFPKTIDHPVLAIEGPAFEMVHLPLAFSG